jgi:hypothetical protein
MLVFSRHSPFLSLFDENPIGEERRRRGMKLLLLVVAFLVALLLYIYGGFAAIQGTKAIVSERVSIIERSVE